MVENDNGYSLTAHATLPEGAALPDRALRRAVTDLGFAGCWTAGDRGTTVLTPSGNMHNSCKSVD